MTFGKSWPCIVGEAGTGHLGSVIRAKELVHQAHAAGADAVKFQIFTPHEELFCPYEGDERRHQRWWDTSLTLDEWRTVKQKADDLGIDFLASAFQPTAVEWLKELNVSAYKVASRAAKTYPYDSVPGPFIISTGFGVPLFPGPVDGFPDPVCYPLHCVPKYPCPLSEARYPTFDGNLSFSGLSDHSGTPWPAMDALARGAKIIEVHFGDKEGPDGPVNLTLDELKLICDFRDALKEMCGG
jgi:sialic acid synthase SpsE